MRPSLPLKTGASRRFQKRRLRYCGGIYTVYVVYAVFCEHIPPTQRTRIFMLPNALLYMVLREKRLSPWKPLFEGRGWRERLMGLRTRKWRMFLAKWILRKCSMDELCTQRLAQRGRQVMMKCCILCLCMVGSKVLNVFGQNKNYV